MDLAASLCLLAVEMAQQAEQHVEHDHRARIADMGVVVDGGPAHIHAHIGGIERAEHPLLARQGIVKPQVHCVRIDGVESIRSPNLAIAGRASIGLEEEKRRPQPALSLANNLPADAEDRMVAVHGAHNGRGPQLRQALARARGSGLAPVENAPAAHPAALSVRANRGSQSALPSSCAPQLAKP